MAGFTELIVTRIGDQRLAVPLGAVKKVLPATAPVRVPSPTPTPPRVTVDEAQLPVWFGAGLMGAARVVLEPSDQMLVLRGEQPVILWVSAVEEVVQAQLSVDKVPGGADELIAGWAQVEKRALPVLDVPRFLRSTHGAP